MIEVLYKPFVKRRGKHTADLYISWDNKHKDDVFQTIALREGALYRDLADAELKVASLLSTWRAENIDTVFIHVPKELVDKGPYTMEHVVTELIGWLMSAGKNQKFRIIVTHDTSFPKSHTIDQVVKKNRRILGARMFAMLPSNVATPKYISTMLKRLFARIPHTTVKVYTSVELRKQGFGLISAVGNSSDVKPMFVVVERKGNVKSPKVVAIAGKGITFDSGGLAIKPLHHMVDMKYDKIGAVYGAAALLHLMEQTSLEHVTFIGAFPLAENAVSSSAVNPGDVATSYSGKTVEIVNPDAEGRLVLADAFGYVEKYKPHLLVDIATLTGHASTINCWHSGYFYASNERLKQAVETITNSNGERMLSMPLWDDYDSVLHSNVADVSNSPLKCSDAFVAALFLKQFVPKGSTWLHIDLAHEFTLGSTPRGRGIRTIIDIVNFYLNAKK